MPEPLDLNNLNTNNEAETPPVASEGSEQEETYGNQFLQQVAEEDREVVSRYISEWDKGVTQQFQKRAEELKQYTSLGDYDALQGATQLAQFLSEDPVGFYTELTQYMNANAEELGWSPNPAPNNPSPSNPNPDMFDGLPEEFVSQYQQMQKTLEDLNNNFGKFSAQQREAEQMKVLDGILQDLHNEHGDFDRDYVLGRIANGKSPEDAISDWNKLVESVVDSRKPKPSAPPIMGAQNGGTPFDQVDPKKLSNPEARKKLGLEFLTKSLGQS